MIISGGQTGVDRAALDAAIAAGLAHGGWCPRGRRAEDGPIDPRYELRETESDEYPARTARNVRDADATLILRRGEITGGTKLTREIAACERPYLVVDLDQAPDVTAVRAWIADGSFIAKSKPDALGHSRLSASQRDIPGEGVG